MQCHLTSIIESEVSKVKKNKERKKKCLFFYQEKHFLSDTKSELNKSICSPNKVILTGLKITFKSSNSNSVVTIVSYLKDNLLTVTSVKALMKRAGKRSRVELTFIPYNDAI